MTNHAEAKSSAEVGVFDLENGLAAGHVFIAFLVSPVKLGALSALKSDFKLLCIAVE